MASIHPSRLGMVPVPQTHPLPPRPAVSAAPSGSDGRGADQASSREEELRRRLLARRQGRRDDVPVPTARYDGDAAEQRGGDDPAGDGYRGKELIHGEPAGGIGILGRAKRDAMGRDEGREVRDEGREVRDEGREVRGVSQSYSEGGRSERGSDRRPSTPPGRARGDVHPEDRSPRRRRLSNERDERRLSVERDGRQRSVSQGVPSPRGGEAVERRGFIHPDRLRLQDQQPDRRARYPEDRRYARSPRRYDDYQPNERGYGQGPARRPEGGLESQPRSREVSLPPSRNGSRRPSPSYRPHDLPPRPPRDGPPPPRDGPLPPQDQARPGAPWMNAQGAMPPFPPNKRLTPADLEQRRAERDRMTFSIWPPSPPGPWRDPDEVEEERRAKRKERRKGKKSKRRSRYSDSETASSDSEYERKRRRRKEKQRERERARERRDSDDEESVDEERRKRRRERTRTRTRSRERTRTGSRERSSTAPRRGTEEVETESEVEGEELWVEKGADARRDGAAAGSGDEGEDVGPKLPVEYSGKDRFKTHYTNMLYGEAEAMAAYAADGKRIPRRGEIGLDAEKIEAFEAAGYVMSGSRHKRMNAVRLRKENQVINAEEKRAILKLQREENVRKEGAIVSQFREMLEEKLREGKDEP